MARETASDAFRRKRQAGAITLLALCMTMALGIALASYLALCTRSAQFSARLLNQEKARQLAQAGLEDALWALNQNSWSSGGPDGTAAWSTSGTSKTLTATYSLPDSTGTGQVTLTIANYASTGPTWPTLTAVATVTLNGGQTYTKTLTAATGTASPFNNAIASAESYVSFISGGTVDSWNSDPDNDSSTAMVAYSFTSGNSSNYNAVIAGKGNGSYGVILTQAQVKGYVSTFGLPVSYSTSGSPAATVKGPSTAAGTSVETARIGKSAFVPNTEVFTVTQPSVNVQTFNLISWLLNIVGGLLSLPANVDSCKITSDYDVDGGIPLLGGSPSMTIDKPVKIIVDGDFSISGSGKITIAATGSLELFVTGDCTIGGNGFVNNTNDPKKLAIYCTSNSTSDSLTYTTAASFCGVIYCENKPIDIQRNGPFYGALMSRQYVKFSGSATAPVFHYDSALRNTRFSGIKAPYLITSVTEN